MKSQITCTWNPDRDEESKITLSEGWKSLPHIDRLDHLQDTLGELMELYNSTLIDWRGGVYDLHNRS